MVKPSTLASSLIPDMTALPLPAHVNDIEPRPYAALPRPGDSSHPHWDNLSWMRYIIPLDDQGRTSFCALYTACNALEAAYRAGGQVIPPQTQIDAHRVGLLGCEMYGADRIDKGFTRPEAWSVIQAAGLVKSATMHQCVTEQDETEGMSEAPLLCGFAINHRWDYPNPDNGYIDPISGSPVTTGYHAVVQVGELYRGPHVYELYATSWVPYGWHSLLMMHRTAARQTQIYDGKYAIHFGVGEREGYDGWRKWLVHR